MAVTIPNGLSDDRFAGFESLLEKFLKALASTGAKRVTSRLNNSNTNTASPVWVGTWESTEVIDNRVKQKQPTYLGAARYKQHNSSKLYREAVNDRSGKVQWKDRKAPEYKPPSEGMDYGLRAGCRWQAFVAIRIAKGSTSHQHVGTLTVGFKKKSSESTKRRVEKIMKEWAQDERRSPYIKYLKRENFKLSGPIRS